MRSPCPLIVTSRHSYHFLFYDCSPYPRALHSFPTRRSSDLARAQLRRELAPHLSPAPPPEEEPMIEMTLDDVLVRVRDRKSTRLNSSHLGISYAVFCLKKKKKHRGAIGDERQ